jgi:hypothetical protein
VVLVLLVFLIPILLLVRLAFFVVFTRGSSNARLAGPCSCFWSKAETKKSESTRKRGVSYSDNHNFATTIGRPSL